MTSNRNTLGRTLLAYLPVNLANVLVSFGLIVVLTRLLSAEEFGRYALAMITLQFAHMGAFTWLEAAMARFQARAERDNDEASHLHTLYALGAGLGLFLTFMFLAIVYLLPLSREMQTVLAFALGSAGLQAVFNLGMEAHRASHRIIRYSLTYSGQTLLSFTIGIALVMLTPLRESGPFLGIIIGLLVGLMVDLPRMLSRQSGGRIEAGRARRYAAYGLPLCLSLLLGYTLNSSDVYIIAALMGEASAGQYNAGYNLANRSLEILFVWVSMAMTPTAIAAFEKVGTEASRDVMRSYGASLLWIVMPAAVGIALVSNDAGFILGESVRTEAVQVMPLIAFAGLMNGIVTYYVQRAFMFSGRTQDIVWLMIPPVLLNIGLNFLLIPRFGLMGAVAATLAGYGAALILTVIAARRHYPLPLPIKAAAQIALACAVMAICVQLLPLQRYEPGLVTLIIKAGTGGAAYLATCWIINAADCRTLVRQGLETLAARRRAVEAAS
ncbi:lipopolysaccharide biosynthesis protein [Algimonas porphyrae]|uniref:Polysaccharide biosynthesis protein n=1 Tax=Algimonas porphyrae TaxID=1128113 RepID=A0ABQ5V2S7_9PROT|nr:lipopolysaccharide biosynthesis protein [Algimonas porphyrae]GLQ21778.1 polysaccharide biosynthesis protein [Algimonas porphyrae]